MTKTSTSTMIGLGMPRIVPLPSHENVASVAPTALPPATM